MHNHYLFVHHLSVFPGSTKRELLYYPVLLNMMDMSSILIIYFLMTALCASGKRYCFRFTGGWVSICCISCIIFFVWDNLSPTLYLFLIQVSSTNNHFNTLSLRSFFSIRKILFELISVIIGWLRLISSTFFILLSCIL